MSTQPETHRAVRLNVKLARGVESRRSNEILSGTPGLKSIIKTFPGETDEELSRLYIVEVDPSKLKPALQKLHDNPEVEYAEETAPRKLIW